MRFVLIKGTAQSFSELHAYIPNVANWVNTNCIYHGKT